MVDNKRENHKKETRSPEKISLVKIVKKRAREQSCQHSYQDGESDWKMLDDKENNLKLHREIITTNGRPERLFISNSIKKDLVELTVQSNM